MFPCINSETLLLLLILILILLLLLTSLQSMKNVGLLRLLAIGPDPVTFVSSF
jgi:hypothetical protein